jgi:hypothetical protein
MKSNRLTKKIILTAAVVGLLSVTSCIKDLEREPITDVTSASIFKDFANYPNALAKLYGGLAIGGQVSGDGGNYPDSDINGINGGFSIHKAFIYIKCNFYR